MIHYFGQIIPGERASGSPSWEICVFCGCCNRWSWTERLKTTHVCYFTFSMGFEFSVGLMRSQSRHPQDCVPSRGSRGESSADSSCLCGLLLPSTKAAIGVRPVFVVAVDRAGFSLVWGLFSACGAWASHRGGFSCHWAQSLGVQASEVVARGSVAVVPRL